ncbi:hypothetical protein GGS23DRAFT_156749 [Durotheca rogersii]|uniref:uncharacterized protein n=1 Tax=Durotheca rogersii TaxID=419775 RepID=UPI002220A12A|nr:uncharacterized protein GGS23DRAFT_156749 [Durotheca rogersii]KAI5861168.1 hypothetical protein GGS23DRAFT_156749 [Durotheca rogersii]
MKPRCRTKVKSGCLTCKARKVKCDEGHPVCSRCLSTGRVCEGYGIWGGGGNQYGHRSAAPSRRDILARPRVPVMLADTVSKEETRCLEWFTHRTAMKLPGAFRSGIWDALIFQAISAEPAVFHAALALSSAHRREYFPVNVLAVEHAPDEQEKFVLHHYSRAIAHLQPHFSIKNNASVRIALLTCLIFVIMEYLRGHYRIGATHLQNGLKLLNEVHARPSAVNNSADAWILQAFVRLDVQAKLLGCGSQRLHIVLDDCAKDSPAIGTVFRTVDEARQHLDRLLSQILHLGDESRRHSQSQDQVQATKLLNRQQRVKSSLDAWFRVLRASKVYLDVQEKSAKIVAYPLLHMYYTLAEIMADTCIRSANESRFDAHAEAFASMMSSLERVRSLTASPAVYAILHPPNMSGSIMDLGAHPVVYYTALKCRTRRTRNKAIRILDGLEHKEGIWNGSLMGSVAREVVKIEEGGFYDVPYTATRGEEPGTTTDEHGNAQPPTLPESYRLHDVEVELPEDYAAKATMRCRRRLEDGKWEVIARRFLYDMTSQSWVNEAEI